MRVLALETSTEFCSSALMVDGEVAERHVLAGQTHSDILLDMVQRLMAEAGLGFAALDAIAFGAGPGSFTGLRIACGAAQGLAFAHDLPVVPVASLEALAEATDAPRVIAAFDARMGELYLAAYERQSVDWRTVLAPTLARPEGLPALPLHEDWLGTGSGFAACGAALTTQYAPVRIDATSVPHAGEVARIAARRVARGETVTADQAVPLYVRDKVALDVREQAALRAQNAERIAREAA